MSARTVVVLAAAAAFACGGSVAGSTVVLDGGPGDGSSDASASDGAAGDGAPLDAAAGPFCLSRAGGAAFWCADFDTPGDALLGYASGAPDHWSASAGPPPAVDTTRFASPPASIGVLLGTLSRALLPAKSVTLELDVDARSDADGGAPPPSLTLLTLDLPSSLVVGIDSTGALIVDGRASSPVLPLGAFGRLRVEAALLSASGAATTWTIATSVAAAGKGTVVATSTFTSDGQANGGAFALHVGPGTFAQGWSVRYDDVVVDLVPR